MRCFIGLPFPKEVVENLTSIVEPLKKQITNKDIRWTPKKNYHITLRFLGDLPKETAENISDKFDQIKFPSFDLQTERLLVLPSLKRPSVLSILLSDGTIKSLKLQINELLNLDNSYEHPHFIPHITIAKIRTRTTFNQEWLTAIPQLIIPIKTVALIASKLTYKGAKYHYLKKITLI